MITDPHVNILFTFSVPEYQSVVVHLFNGTEHSDVDVKQFRNRPPTQQYRVSFGNETFTIICIYSRQKIVPCNFIECLLQ
ncbi:hypothetical protein DPMN_146677 [Dreissena polymorpha]|uniref:Uncharacterized protein n=1 Tax=Dreissena polymorpha TaxID=45954 RepID=A0A9D4FC71_DREPO|nr:hypothetical protein DPMN_146677 [Dreissena polymorpha]